MAPRRRLVRASGMGAALRGLVVLGIIGASMQSAAAAPASWLWSPTVEGVHARLALTKTLDARKRPQIEVWLEIENVSDTDGGIPLAWGYVGDMLKLTLEDARGKPMTPGGVSGSVMSGASYAVNLPVGATLRVPVSRNAIEYQAATPMMFHPLAFQGWDLPARRARLFVRATLTPHAQQQGQPTLGDRAWTVPLELPKVELP